MTSELWALWLSLLPRVVMLDSDLWRWEWYEKVVTDKELAQSKALVFDETKEGQL